MALEEDDDFRLNPEGYFLTDRLLSIHNAASADAYVDQIRHASVHQLEAIIKTLYQVTEARLITERRERRPPTRPTPTKGGATRSPEFYRFMCLCDTVHDFGKEETRAESEAKVLELQAVLGAELPREVAVSDMLNEVHLVELLSARRTLHFSTGPIDNPLFNARILDNFDLVGALQDHPGADLEKLYSIQQRSLLAKLGARASLVHVDVLCAADTTNQRLALINLHHVAQLIGVMRSRIGQDASFQVDATDDQLVLLVCSLDHVSKAFLRKFNNPPTMELVRQQLREHMASHDIDVRWTTTMSDANLFDAAEKSTVLPVDPRPTGPIYAPYVPYQIDLHGIVVDSQKRKSVHATITDTGGSHTHVVTGSDSKKVLSTQVIDQLVGLPHIPHPKNLRDHVVNCTRPLQYALKRAGDWGQVEHAAKYGKVFVTSDKLAALYAWYRGVRFVYLRRQENLARTMPSLPAFHRYTWAISGLRSGLV